MFNLLVMRKLVYGILLFFMMMLNSCASTVSVRTGTLYGNYDYITDVYYESNRDLIVVYINQIPYYKMWDLGKRVYYYAPVPRAYWTNIVYRPYHVYGYPKYYRHLPAPYKYNRNYNYRRYNSTGRRVEPHRKPGGRPNVQPTRPIPERKPNVGRSGSVNRRSSSNSSVSRSTSGSSRRSSTTSRGGR